MLYAIYGFLTSASYIHRVCLYPDAWKTTHSRKEIIELVFIALKDHPPPVFPSFLHEGPGNMLRISCIYQPFV